MAIKRPGYREALAWIVGNDDTEWLTHEHGQMSVTAALVADLFDKTDEQVTADLRNARRPDRWQQPAKES